MMIAITLFIPYLYRGLLDDTYFIQAVKKVMEEPIPYFKQFTAVKMRPQSAPLSSTPRDDSSETENLTTQDDTEGAHFILVNSNNMFGLGCLDF